MLSTDSIVHQYSGTQKFTFPDFQCNPAETILVLGQSGVGKTTLLHILAGILKPDQGNVFINEQSLYGLPGSKRDKYRGQNIGLVFQKPHFIASLTAEQNLQIAQKMAGQKQDSELINQLFTTLNLAPKKNSYTYNMSQGELQRLSIARALINNPKIILADEPTSALDDKNCDEVIQLLERHAKEVGAALIIVTHDNRLKKMFDNQVELY